MSPSGVAPPAPVPFHHPAGEGPAVRGTLHAAARPGDGLVLTHGAGGSADSPLLVAIAEALARRGVAVLRCDLPFRQARAHGPPTPAGAARDRAGLRAAARALAGRAAGAISLGGHSYGGRQASLLAAEDPAAAPALLLLAYPLHPPGRPAELRVAHWPALRTPALFVHGTTDPFGSPVELGEALARIPARTALHLEPGAGHDLGGPRRSRAALAAVAERVAERWVAFQAGTPARPAV